MINLNDVIKAVSHVQKTSRIKPIRIKMNEKWLEKQIEDKVIFFKKDTDKPVFSSFMGIPIEIDNSINTFEFVYREGTI